MTIPKVAGEKGPAIENSVVERSQFPRVKIEESRASTVIFHTIKDEELDVLSLGDQSHQEAIAWASLGAGAGSLPYFFSILMYLSGAISTSPGKLDIIMALVCGVCFATGIAVLYASRKDMSRSRKLITEIRQRPRHASD